MKKIFLTLLIAASLKSLLIGQTIGLSYLTYNRTASSNIFVDAQQVYPLTVTAFYDQGISDLFKVRVGLGGTRNQFGVHLVGGDVYDREALYWNLDIPINVLISPFATINYFEGKLSKFNIEVSTGLLTRFRITDDSEARWANDKVNRYDPAVSVGLHLTLFKYFEIGSDYKYFFRNVIETTDPEGNAMHMKNIYNKPSVFVAVKYPF